jgi:hypothetical protein
MAVENSTDRLPDTKLLRVMTKDQLLIVWRDILYVLNNMDKTPSKDGHKEQYVAYAFMVYAYLIKEGSSPNKTNVHVDYNPNFSYIAKFDTWLNTAKLRNYLIKQHIVNDGNFELGSRYVEKLWEKEQEKGNVLNGEYSKQELLDLINSQGVDKEIGKKVLSLLINGHLEEK